jgi:hypothetical protein
MDDGEARFAVKVDVQESSMALDPEVDLMLARAGTGVEGVEGVGVLERIQTG